MEAEETKLKGCMILHPRVFKDERGYFFESFNQKTFEGIVGRKIAFVQDNQSFSTYGTIRGLHFQRGASAQAKLVRVLEGEVLDVAVDLRPGSATYGQWVGVSLSADRFTQFFVPRGFAHGFSVLSDRAVFAYKCDNYYDRLSEGGIVYNDRTLSIDWQVPAGRELVSEKDLLLPFFNP